MLERINGENKGLAGIGKAKPADLGKTRPVGNKTPAAANKAQTVPEKPLPLRAVAVQAAEGRAKPPAINLKQLIYSLKLPQDRLSATLVSFARKFSLPLEPALLSRLRKEALTLQARGRVSVESAALAATAAAGKGVILSDEALEQYARAIDPDYAADERDPDSSGQEEGQPSGGGSFDGRDGDAGHSGSQDRRDRADEDNQAREIREILGEALARLRENGEAGAPEEDSLPGLLNRLPGREGDFWIVYPFKINAENLEFRVSVWVLLLYKDSVKNSTEGNLSGGFSGNSIREITVNAVGKMRRWVFSVTNPGRPEAKTRVSVSPPYGEPVRKKVEREIREILGDFGGELTLKGNEVSLIPEMWDQDAGWPFFFADNGPSTVEEEA
jgi:hypothetical protein